MKFGEFKKVLEDGLIQICKDRITERGGRPGQVTIIDSDGQTEIKVYGSILETIKVPVQLSGPATTLDEKEIES